MKMIKQAEKSIWIFTPYLDFTINKLLRNSKDEIEIVIITSLDGDSLFQRGYQLEALKELIAQGIVVRNLSGLHAKVLLVDDDLISLGSQNFTSRGRKNKEAGFQSNVSFFGSDILKILKDWCSKAQFVNAELIDSLLQYVKDNQDELSSIKAKFEEDVKTIINELSINQEAFTITKSDNHSSTIRFPQGEAILTKILSGEYNNHYSFYAGDNNNLLTWTKTNVNGKEEIFEIPDRYYFPALNLKNLEMAFLRLHKTRITYMKSGFKIEPEFYFNNAGEADITGLKIKDKRFSIDFGFCKRNTKEANIKITLSNSDLGNTTLYFLFNSINFKMVKHESSNKDCKIFITDNFLSNQRQVNDFLKEQILYQYRKTPNNQPAEIEKFLIKNNYKLGVIYYENCPILIFEEY